MNVDQAKSIRIDEFLENLGYVCDKETAGRKWFRFRDEKTASFVVSKDGGAFFDHGTGEHGNIIDVAKIAANTDSVSDALKYIENHVDYAKYSIPTIRQTLPVQPAEPYYSVVYDAKFSIYGYRGSLTPAAAYLKAERGISPEAVYPYFRDVFHKSSDTQKKPFYAFGLPNVAGGFEGRTFFHGKWHKRTIGNKDVTAFKSANENAPWLCFYSMMDFGTFLTTEKPEKDTCSYLIVNGDGLVDKALSYLEGVKPTTLVHYPHNDPSGQLAYERMKAGTCDWDGGSMAYKYEGFKDLTEKREKELGLDKLIPMAPAARNTPSPKYRP